MTLEVERLPAAYSLGRCRARGRRHSDRTQGGPSAPIADVGANPALPGGAHVGWRATGLLLFLPLAVWIVRDTPEQIGLLPDGEAPSGVEAEGIAPWEDGQSWTLARAANALLLVPHVLRSGAVAREHRHHVPDLLSPGQRPHRDGSDRRPSEPERHRWLRRNAGRRLDCFPFHKIVPARFALMLLQLIVLLNTQSLWEAALFAVIWGISSSLLTVAFNVVWLAYFGGYQQVLWVMMILPDAAAVLSLLSPPPSFRHGASGSATASSH